VPQQNSVAEVVEQLDGDNSKARVGCSVPHGRYCHKKVKILEVCSMEHQINPNDMWEERYGAEHYAYGTEPNSFLAEHVSALPMGTVFCLADGEGRNSVFVASTGRQVGSVDLSQAGVNKALALAAVRGVIVDAVVGDLADFDLGNERFDAIVSIFAHVPSSLRKDLHARVMTALKPGGVFLLEAYTPRQIGRGTGGPMNADFTMSLEGLREELEPLEFLHAVERDREVIEGTFHNGLASVVQLIAKKPG